MMHKHSQEMSEAFFAGCCQARQFKGHAPTSTHGELQKNPNKLAELDRLGVDQMELGELQKGPSVLEMMVDLKGPSW